MESNEIAILQLMTLSYYNFTLIRDLTDELLENSDMKLNEFYKKWSIKYFKKDIRLLPLNSATVLMISYVNFLAARQIWFDIFDDKPISKIDKKWGLHNAEIQCDMSCDPPLNYVLKRMRNGLAHYRIEVTEIKELRKKDNIEFRDLMDNSYFIIRDENIKGEDKFMIKINFTNLAKLNSEVYTTISNHFRKHIWNY